MKSSYFEDAAATWDNEPRRVAMAKAVGETILREARPTKDMDMLDYGCGTGLLSLYLLPHVHSVTGADSSAGMLQMLQTKLKEADIQNLKILSLDLEQDRLPDNRYHLVVTNMTLHHVAATDRVLRAFHDLLLPGGTLCIADLDTEPGIFHTSEAAASVHHHGFDRAELTSQLSRIGFHQIRDVTAHTIRRPIETGEQRDFPVFLITANRR